MVPCWSHGEDGNLQEEGRPRRRPQQQINGLNPGFWEQQGGRQAAAAAKAKRTAEAQAKADEVKRQKRDFWQQWVAPSSTQQTTGSQQQSTQPTAEAEQPQPAQQQPALPR